METAVFIREPPFTLGQWVFNDSIVRACSFHEEPPLSVECNLRPRAQVSGGVLAFKETTASSMRTLSLTICNLFAPKAEGRGVCSADYL